MANNNNNIECQANGKFKRLRPFNGMLLTAEDVQLEQNYFREKIKLHNRLHGFGVVCGLEIKPCEDEEPQNIIVTPGMALDYNGNEIIVCENPVVELKEYINTLFAKFGCVSAKAALEKSRLYIGIKYNETPSDPVAVIATDCEAQAKRSEFARMTECFCIGVFIGELPWQPTADEPPFSFPLGQSECPLRPEREHYIILGSISFSSQTDPITDEMIDNYWENKSASSVVSSGKITADKPGKSTKEEINQVIVAKTMVASVKPMKKKSQKVSPKK